MKSAQKKARTLAIVLGAPLTDLRNHGKAKQGDGSARAFDAALSTIDGVIEELNDLSQVEIPAFMADVDARASELGREVL